MLSTIRLACTALCLSLIAAPAAEARVSCSKWNTVSFFETAKAADIARCIRRNANPNARDRKFGAGPLHRAAALSRDPAAVQALIRAGARIEARDKHGKAPLQWAATHSRTPSVVKALLRAGANVRTRDRKGWTVLHWAASNSRSPGVVRALVRAGADLEARSDRRSGMRPLHKAAIGHKSLAAVSVLLEAGADPNARGGRLLGGMTPLHLAARTGKSAAKTAALVNALLDAGADARARDRTNRTPSDYAAGNRALRHSSVARRLRRATRHPPRRTMARRPNPAPAGPCAAWNTQAFFEAASPADIEKCLGKAGKSVNARDAKNGGTPLHRAAAYSRSPAVVVALLKAGAKLEARSNSGSTPLHWAAAYSRTPTAVEALLAAGADSAVQNGKGKRPADLIAGNRALRDTAVARTLAAAARRPGTAAVAGKASRKPSTERAEQPHMAGTTETQVSCSKWNTQNFFETATAADVAECLKTGGFRVDARDFRNNGTPLHWAAAYSRNPEVVATLLKAGADIEARGNRRGTPLHAAAVYGKTPAVVAVLLDAGANLAAKDRKGKTPADYIAGNRALRDTAIARALAAARRPGTAAVAGKAPRKPSAGRPDKGNEDPEMRPHAGAAGPGECGRHWRTKRNGAPDWPQIFRSATGADVADCIETGKIEAGRSYKYNVKAATGGASFATALHWAAAYSESPGVVTALVKAGANVQARDNKFVFGNERKTGRTPLHWAAIHGNPALVAALVKAGANPDARDLERNTPLHRAARFAKNPVVIAALLDAGADATARTRYGAYPYDYLLKNKSYNPKGAKGWGKGTNVPWRLWEAKSVACEHWTIDAKAKSRKNDNNLRAFFRAATAAEVTRCLGIGAMDLGGQYFSSGFHPFGKSKARNFKGTPLHWAAAYSRKPEVVKTLLKAGADIEAKTEGKRRPLGGNDFTPGQTPLHWAAHLGQTQAVVGALLDAGANAAAKDSEGKLPSDYIAGFRWKRCPISSAACRDFHNAGNRNLRNSEIERRLRRLEAVTCGAWNTPKFFGNATAADVAKCLLNDKTSVDAQHGSRSTPLHLAGAHTRDPAVVATLIEAGADIAARGKDGTTPLHEAAAKNGNPAVVAALLKAGADVAAQTKSGVTPLHFAARSGKAPGVVAALVKAGADAGARDKRDNTPLHTAARYSMTPAVVTALAKAGADAGAEDKKGNTPLHTAARYSVTPAIVTAFAKAGADLNARRKNGWTPLHAAAVYGGDPAVAAALAAAGADANARDRNRWTPLHWAVQAGAGPALVTALLDAGADPAARNGDGAVPWDLADSDSGLKGTEAGRRLQAGKAAAKQ